MNRKLKGLLSIILVAALAVTAFPAEAMAYTKHTYTYASNGTLPGLSAGGYVYKGDEYSFTSLSGKVSISLDGTPYEYPGYAGQTYAEQGCNAIVESNGPRDLKLLSAYDIKFELNGGMGSYFENRFYTFADFQTNIQFGGKEPEKAGYTFDGWYTDEALSQPLSGSIYYQADRAQVTLYAKWAEVAMYSIACSTAANGSVVADKTSAEEGDVITLTVTPAAGYELKTLTAVDAGGNQLTISSDDTFTMPAANVTVTAVFQLKVVKYSVTCSTAANGSVVADPTSAAEGDVVTLTVFPDDDYELETLTAVDAGGNQLTISSDDTFTMPASNVTVTAKFREELVENTVTFDLGGKGENFTRKVASGSCAERPANPVKTGWTFAGWFKDSLKQFAFDFNTKITEDTTVYAAWSAQDDEPNAEARPVKTGTWNDPVTNGTWTFGSDGKWTYTTNAMFKNTWGYIRNPYAKAGQPTDGWFWFDANGKMLTGWQEIGGKWYYLNATSDGTLGMCFLDTVTPDGFRVDKNGARIQ